MRRASASATAVLPTPGSPRSMTELARSRWQRISMICWSSSSRPKTGGSLSCRASRFRLTANCLQKRRQLVALAQLLVAQLDVADDGGQPRR